MENTIISLKQKLDTLTVFRGLLEDPAVVSFMDLAFEIKDYLEDKSMEDDEDCFSAADPSEAVSAYCRFVSDIYSAGVSSAGRPAGDLSAYVRDLVMRDENFYVIGKAAGRKIGKQIEDSLERELAVLQEFSQLTSAKAKKALPDVPAGTDLPSWRTSSTDLVSEYREMIEKLPVTGYGMYARYRAFSVKDGQITPVKYPDPQRLDQLYRYERERALIIKNTEALVSGKGASNMLLYGDAGTGKSSTIKAVANEYAGQGLRLIEIKKEQLYEIPDILNELSSNPLKFILFIDDLSFSGNDDNFSALKAVLEGSVSAFGKNVAIYATSNRRHLVRETMSQREGDDIHVNDTLQELTSLAARFGLNITFSSPGKKDYLDIVRNLAEEYGIKMSEEELFLRAERFAIRANGRSPRVAKQFIELEKIGISY
ncbi:MAG: ATP-binding protein [Bacillota bacterium]|nr:ATP-binding protein [Bacillota bacterium]